MTFSCVPPTQLMLEVASEVQAQSWQQSQASVPLNGRWNIYLNQICLHTFLPWLQEEYAPQAKAWMDDASFANLWQVVNGVAISVDTKRLVLIPDKSLDNREIRVPQEWIDIPGWAADYYLAVQVNPEGDWIRVWGYTTHQELKAHAEYDTSDRTYCLDAIHMVEDLNVLWVVRQLNPDEPTKADISPLPTLTPTQVEEVIHRLANSALAAPRLELPFELWGALLEREDWQQQLDRLWQQESARAEFPAATAKPVHLSQWFQNVFDETWQAIEQLLGTEPEFAFNFRQAQDVTDSLIRRVKLIQLPTQQGGEALLLVLSLGTESDGRMNVRVQLYPVDRRGYLPANLHLTLLSDSETIIQSVQSREQDDCIQLKRFKCPPGKEFMIQVAVADFCFTEQFMS